eukprot:TRINITY_DN3686_c0_g1_i1.p1 TRINITY_DN3686_c0_g1~~TRINITY_DN3686_c0_g1_i1.p1  ORF type:complete len:814 (+),score=108.46 TRINITY_DN3686_c0_g1_i1:37-2442(+)
MPAPVAAAADSQQQKQQQQQQQMQLRWEDPSESLRQAIDECLDRARVDLWQQVHRIAIEPVLRFQGPEGQVPLIKQESPLPKRDLAQQAFPKQHECKVSEQSSSVMEMELSNILTPPPTSPPSAKRVGPGRALLNATQASMGTQSDSIRAPELGDAKNSVPPQFSDFKGSMQAPGDSATSTFAEMLDLEVKDECQNVNWAKFKTHGTSLVVACRLRRAIKAMSEARVGVPESVQALDQDFQLDHTWRFGDYSHAEDHAEDMEALPVSQRRESRTQSQRNSQLKRTTVSRRRCMFSTNSVFCLFWDIWTTVMMAFDVAVMPLESFDLSAAAFFTNAEIASTSTWLCDMILTFLRAFPRVNGQDEDRHSIIALKYVRSWFTIDLSLVSIGLALVVLEGSPWMKYVSVLRLLRMLRMLRLLRIVRMISRIKVLTTMLNAFSIYRMTERGTVMFRMAKNLAVIIVINHLIACLWFNVGTLDESSMGWVSKHHDLYNRPFDAVYNYLTAYHWSITQVTPASMEVFPVSSAERVFNIGVILGGLCIFSSFISSMNQSMAQLQAISKEERERSEMLRRYMSEQGLTVELARSIARFLQNAGSTGGFARPVKLSELCERYAFPDSLLEKLRIESVKYVTCEHVLFDYFHFVQFEIFREMAKSCFVEKLTHRLEDLFHSGGKGLGMYFVTYGTLGYDIGRGDATSNWIDPELPKEPTGKSVIKATAGSWVSEHSLWLDWQHQGALYGLAPLTDVLHIGGESFRTVVARDAKVMKEVRMYARLFALRVMRSARQGEKVDDLWSPRAASLDS